VANPPVDFNGLWRYNWDSPQLDQRAAEAMGCLGPHGTYTRVQYFTVHMSDKNGLANAVLDVFNEDGDFGRFFWNGTDAWQADPTPVTFTAKAGTKFVTKDAQIALTPNLALDYYDETNCPSNARAGKGYVKSMTTPMPATQRIVPDPSGKWFTWKLAEGDEGLDFTSCYQQPSAASDNGDKSFGDTFRGQSKLAQLGFPYYGFNPSNMDLYASQPYELAPTGPGTPSVGVYSTNPSQTFNGTLVFAFPTNDSTDYVRAEDLPDQPYLPLGLGERSNRVVQG
jgi:hypothetical protein